MIAREPRLLEPDLSRVVSPASVPGSGEGAVGEVEEGGMGAGGGVGTALAGCCQLATAPPPVCGVGCSML